VNACVSSFTPSFSLTICCLYPLFVRSWAFSPSRRSDITGFMVIFFKETFCSFLPFRSLRGNRCPKPFWDSLRDGREVLERYASQSTRLPLFCFRRPDQVRWDPRRGLSGVPPEAPSVRATFRRGLARSPRTRPNPHRIRPVGPPDARSMEGCHIPPPMFLGDLAVQVNLHQVFFIWVPPLPAPLQT